MKNLLWRIKGFLRFLLYILPHKLAHSILYYRAKNKKLNWKNPQTFDEKIHWLIVNRYDREYGKYADKLQVCDYIRECGLESILRPIIKVYDTAEDIRWEELPDQFVIKTTHGSGSLYYEIVADKSRADLEALRSKMKAALATNYAVRQCEYHYAGCTSPKIICEKLLKSSHADSKLDDYKVFCFDGVPKAILVCSDGFQGRDFYTADWEYLDIMKEKYKYGKPVEKPALLKEMLDAAARLSKPFPLSRIDFYIADNRLYFGEITLTPCSGDHRYLTEKGQMELGRMIEL